MQPAQNQQGLDKTPSTSLPIMRPFEIPPTQPSLPFSTPSERKKSAALVPGMKEKRHILDQYENEFGLEYPESIITKKKGKPSHDPFPLIRSARMRPALDKYY
jgi:hypothetical protein